jgi:type IV pilus assembly protein PilA
MKINKKNQSGFTLVEMMISVAIIGVLASVSMASFKKYQAKAKTVEAKIQLAQAYTAQKSFYQIFEMYATCLDYMGYDPTAQANSRFYSVGFPDVTANIDLAIYTSALADRLVPAACPRDLVDTPDKSIFLAGKAIGSSVLNTALEFQDAAVLTTNSLTMGQVGMYAGIGEQINTNSKTFVVGAAGYIEAKNLTPLQASYWTVDQNKKIMNLKLGY